MGIRNKIITAVFAILICASAFAITAYATETGSDIITDEPTEGVVDVTDEPDIPATDDPYVGDETYAPDEPVTDDPYEVTDPYYEPSTEETYDVETTDPYYEPIIPDYTYPYVEEEEPPYFSDGDEVYVGGGQSGYTVPDHTMPSAPLYDADRPIDDKVLSKNDWNDIVANLANAGSKENNDDADDFNFIKKNDSKTDNGDWMLYTGIALIVLSVAGITYAIVSAVKNRSGKAFTSVKKPAYTHAAHAKFDTADVKLPKGAKHSGGKRFK